MTTTTAMMMISELQDKPRKIIRKRLVGTWQICRGR